MITCNMCGHYNADDETFCGSCGTFLAWNGTHVAEPPPPAPEPEPEPVAEDPARPGLMQRVKAVVLDQGQATQAHDGGGQGVATPVATPPPTPAPDAPAPAAWGAPPSTAPPAPAPAPAPPAPTPAPPPAPGAPPATGPAAAAPWGAPPQPAAAPSAWGAPPASAPAPAPAPPPAPPAPSGVAAPPVPAPTPAPAPAPAAPTPPPAAPTPTPTPPPEAAAPTPPTAPPPGAVPTPVPTPTPTPIPTPTPSESFDVEPDAQAAARARQEAENARRYAAERARQEAEEAEREAFRKRQEAAAALFEQPVAPTPTPLPGQQVPPPDSGRWGPAPTPAAAAAPSTQAQLPGAAEAKRFAPRPTTQTTPPKPGDLVCDSCGSGNDQARKFCRQCGASLVKAVVEPPLPWWKRFFKRSKKRVPAARPTGPGRPTKKTQRKRTARRVIGYVRMGVALLAILAVLGFTFITPWRTKATDFGSCKKRQVQAILKPPVKNVALKGGPTASRELPDHPAIKAFDSNPATFWQAPPPAPGDPLITLNAEFLGAATVRQIHFFAGLPKANNPASQPSPKTVLLTFKNERGETVGKQERFVLETNVSKEDQLLKLKAKKDVTSVEVAVLDVYPSQTGGTQVAISDVQFFGSPAQPAGEKCKVG